MRVPGGAMKYLGNSNLEVFKFGMYVLFPVAIMYYYGTNLEQQFSTPDFWPKPEQTNRIPFERDEIKNELERLREKRLWLRDQRIRNMGRGGDGKGEGEGQ